MSESFQVRDRQILNVATGLAWVGIVIALVTAVAGLSILFDGGVPVQATTDVGTHGAFEGSVLIADPSWVLRLLFIASVLCASGGFVMIMLAVLALVRSARRGEAFLPGMRSALIAVAGGIVVWVVGTEFLPGIASMLADGALPSGFHFYANIPLWPVMIVVVLGVIAGVFEVGARLREDTEGLV